MTHTRAREIVAASDPWLGLGRPGTGVQIMDAVTDGVTVTPDLGPFVTGLASVIDEMDQANLVNERPMRTGERQISFVGADGSAYASVYGVTAAPDGGSLTDASFGLMYPRTELPIAARSMFLPQRSFERSVLRRFAIALLDLSLGMIDDDLPKVPGEVTDASLEPCHEFRDSLPASKRTQIARTFCSFPLLGSEGFVQGMRAGSPVGFGAPVSGLPQAASLWVKREYNKWSAEIRPFTTSSLLTEESDAMRRLRRIRMAQDMGINVGRIYRRRLPG